MVAWLKTFSHRHCSASMCLDFRRVGEGLAEPTLKSRWVPQSLHPLYNLLSVGWHWQLVCQWESLVIHTGGQAASGTPCEFLIRKQPRVVFMYSHLAKKCLLVLTLLLGAENTCGQASELDQDFFEKSVRPLLVERCLKCHGSIKQSGGLRLDSRANMLKGGESGPAIVIGKTEDSLLIQAVRREGGLEMPPDEKLTAAELRVLEHWIQQGAAWPESKVLKTITINEKAKTHWAFQPLKMPAVPKHETGGALQHPLDAFVLKKLDQHGLSHAKEADRPTLIRRLSYTLTGLPPTRNEVQAFLEDDKPQAYERLVDRLLTSPHYGEHWGRYWLDLARYSDTKGYVYAREERFWVHAWTYRDWVVKSLNQDVPYNRFLLLQLAGDQLKDRQPGDLAAMGFLTLGRRFLGVEREIIDDRIDVVCRGTMALTVACARCHDHKYDPIPTADYYSLYGVFDSSAERMVALNSQPARDAAFQNELKSRQQKLKAKMDESRKVSSERVRARLKNYLQAQTELEKYPPQGFDQIYEPADMLPEFVMRWEKYLQRADKTKDPIFRHWHAYRKIPIDEFSETTEKVTRQLAALKPGSIHPRVAKAFQKPPRTFEEVIDRYAKLFAEVEQEWQALLKTSKDALPIGLTDKNAEALRQVLYGPSAPCEVPDLPVVHTESFFDSATCTALWKLQGEVDRWMIRSSAEIPFALTMVDRQVPIEPRIFHRGDPKKLGPNVPRHFLSLLTGPNPKPFQKGSGRLELARAIVDPANPLTARVIVNRVWAKHFGKGLVITPSDFGLRANPPSHPALLDWLTLRFIEEGWSLKWLHREILLSRTFRQSSLGLSDPKLQARAVTLDPANRLLWRMNPHRLTFEEIRDSLLAATGKLNPKLGGKPVEKSQSLHSSRRTIYGLVDRQFFPTTLRIFDVASPDLHIAQRRETTVPQQSLFFLNHPLVISRARELAKLAQADNLTHGVQNLFHRGLGRDPTAEELADALEFLETPKTIKAPPRPDTAKDWQYGFGFYEETKQQVKGFQPLPYFSGNAWQGGVKWPDAKLGWVQLTAEGGHPGNTRQHAAIRRWTAPQKMTLKLHSKLVHEAKPGDGIRAFLVHSQQGELLSETIHQKTAEGNIDAIQVQPGDTLDFVVDIGKILNSDQYQWMITLTARQPGNKPLVWDSRKDFPAAQTNRLTPWEQLAHVLICSNEFLFVD